MAGRLNGKVAVVTGSSSGNGRAVALALAREGAAVVCSDVRADALEGGYEEDIATATHDVITGEGGRAVYVGADVTKRSDVDGLVEAAVSEFGRLDVMVNNAGVFTGLHTIVDETDDQWDFTMAVNATGVFYGCRAAIRQMLAQPDDGEGSRGKVINIASIGGWWGWLRSPRTAPPRGPWSTSRGSSRWTTRPSAST